MRNHMNAFFSRGCGGLFQIELAADGNYEYIILLRFSFCYKRFIDCPARLSDAFCNVLPAQSAAFIGIPAVIDFVFV